MKDKEILYYTVEREDGSNYGEYSSEKEAREIAYKDKNANAIYAVYKAKQLVRILPAMEHRNAPIFNGGE